VEFVQPARRRPRAIEQQDQREWEREAADDPRVERDAIDGIKPNSDHHTFGNTRQILLLKVPTITPGPLILLKIDKFVSVD
jgi:hypothetical protein